MRRRTLRTSPQQQQLRHFVGDRTLHDLDPNRRFLVVYPRAAAEVAQQLKDLFPDVRFSFQERPATCRQRAQEGEAIDSIIDWVGIAKAR
jgi:hypothetical protein